VDMDNLVSTIPAIISDSSNFQERDEIKMLRTGTELNLKYNKMTQMQWVPKVNAFLDIGAQSENWKWNNRSKYFLVGIAMDMPIFKSFRNSCQIRQRRVSADNS